MSDQAPSMPPGWPERIRALLSGELRPVEPRRAATVVLLRHGPAGPEAYLLRRRTTMAFAAGMYAYPGGAVDPRDGEVGLDWSGPSAAEWAARLGCDEAGAQAVVCAAVRETFEESGVLLAGPDPDSVVSDTAGDGWRADRAALEAHDLSFADLLRRRGLVLRSDLLGGWARWITPEFEERRYDTWFFVAALPEGQRTAEVPGEADRVAWMRPADAVAGHAAGRYRMFPPTVTTLRELTVFGSPEEALAASAGRTLAPVLATARLDGGRVRVQWPGYPGLALEGVLGAGPGGEGR